MFNLKVFALTFASCIFFISFSEAVKLQDVDDHSLTSMAIHLGSQVFTPSYTESFVNGEFGSFRALLSEEVVFPQHTDERTFFQQKLATLTAKITIRGLSPRPIPLSTQNDGFFLLGHGILHTLSTEDVTPPKEALASLCEGLDSLQGVVRSRPVLERLSLYRASYNFGKAYLVAEATESSHFEKKFCILFTAASQITKIQARQEDFPLFRIQQVFEGICEDIERAILPFFCLSPEQIRHIGGYKDCYVEMAKKMIAAYTEKIVGIYRDYFFSSSEVSRSQYIDIARLGQRKMLSLYTKVFDSFHSDLPPEEKKRQLHESLENWKNYKNLADCFDDENLPRFRHWYWHALIVEDYNTLLSFMTPQEREEEESEEETPGAPFTVTIRSRQ